MRIRRRPPFSSFPSFTTTPTASPHSRQDLSLHLPPLAPNGRDASANSGGGGGGEARDGKVAPELHPGEHRPKYSHAFAQDPCQLGTPLHPPLPLLLQSPPPPPSCPDPYDDTKGHSIHSCSTHMTDVAHGKVQDSGEEEAGDAAAAAAAKKKKKKSQEERGIFLDAKMGRDDNAQQVNSNMRIDGSSGASILLEAARHLEAAAATETRKKGRGRCGDALAVNDDCGSEEKLKEKKKKKKEKKRKKNDNNKVKASGCGSVDGRDKDGYHNGDGPAAVMEELEEEGGVAVNGNVARSNGKKRRSPAVLMEGSRCSRVNGRGWRCCQQTLVGYSLCEHHLGKGRLRSMSSVRGQIGATTRPKKKNSMTPTGQEEEHEDQKRTVQLLLLQQQQQQQQQEEPSEVNGTTTTDMEKKEMEGGENSGEDKATKKRTRKMGMVKARSISSLLDGVELSATPPAQSLITGNSI